MPESEESDEDEYLDEVDINKQDRTQRKGVSAEVFG